jgi:serine/threonine protein kinase
MTNTAHTILKLFCLLRYETSAHFWLVLEYCVGGDLKGLLEQVFGLKFN